MKKKIITLWMAVGVIPLGSMAQESWTLRQCIDYAISHNISVKQSENAAEQSNVDVNTAKWARLPNLNAGAEQSFNWGRTSRPYKIPSQRYIAAYTKMLVVEELIFH
jgi:outer membrane protein